MSSQLDRIENALAQIAATLERQTIEVHDLLDQLQKIVLVSAPKSTGVVIDPDCGYEWIWLALRLDAGTWSRIKAGEHIELRGRGWVPEQHVKPDPADENFYWDYWEFNGGINKPMRVTMVSPHEDSLDIDDRTAYEGPLLKSFIHELKDI
jgi:hypothetical protein